MLVLPFHHNFHHITFRIFCQFIGGKCIQKANVYTDYNPSGKAYFEGIVGGGFP